MSTKWLMQVYCGSGEAKHFQLYFFWLKGSLLDKYYFSSKNQIMSLLSRSRPCSCSFPTSSRIRKEDDVPQEVGSAASRPVDVLSCSTGFWVLASFEISFMIFRNGEANTSGDSCYWKYSFLLTIPKRRGHSEQGAAWRAAGSVRRE